MKKEKQRGMIHKVKVFFLFLGKKKTPLFVQNAVKSKTLGVMFAGVAELDLLILMIEYLAGSKSLPAFFIPPTVQCIYTLSFC